MKYCKRKSIEYCVSREEKNQETVSRSQIRISYLVNRIS